MGSVPLESLVYIVAYVVTRHTILASASVNLESILIGIDIELDACEIAGYTSDGSHCMPVVGPLLRPINDIAVVVTCAICSAVSEQLRRRVVRADLLGRGPEIVDRVFLIREDDAIRDEDSVDTDALAGIWQGQSVVQCGRGIGVSEAIQIPVSLFHQQNAGEVKEDRNLHASSA